MAQPVIQYFVRSTQSSLSAGPYAVNQLPEAKAYAKKIAGSESSPVVAVVEKRVLQTMFTYTPAPRPDPTES